MFVHAFHHPFFKKEHPVRGKHENVVESPFFYSFRVGHVTNKKKDKSSHDCPEIEHDFIVCIHIYCIYSFILLGVNAILQ
jgi:hypothetical protein